MPRVRALIQLARIRVRASNGLLFFVRRPAARGIGAGGIDRTAPFLDVGDLPFLVHHKRSAVGHAGLGYENAISSGHLAIEKITQQWERSTHLGGEFFLGGSIVGADAKNLGVVALKFRNTSLVCRDFARSTTGESGGEKCQHNGVFAAEDGKRNFTALGGRQSEVRGHVAYLQSGMRGLDVLGE